VKETIESILIAFILAFVFRAYVVEAFVIPTGSMAPTLLGAHTRETCADCGHDFTVNVSGPRSVDGRDDIAIPADTSNIDRPDVYCPNCGFLVHPQRRAGEVRLPAVPVHYGDRLLVMKYLYLLEPPTRWDVVVFKSPYDPGTYDYTQNYIKRLVGLPGESLMVLDGDVYTRQGETDPWQIQSKPWPEQQALWRVVYDNDKPPQGLDRGVTAWQQPWRPEPDAGGWKVGEKSSPARVFHFDNPTGSGAIGYDAGANATTQTLSDYLVYDVAGEHFRRPPTGFSLRNESRFNPVSDLMLRCYYRRKAGDGPLRVELGKGTDVFTAELQHGSARILLTRAGAAPVVLCDTASSTDRTSTAPVLIEFMNVDHRVSLRLDGREVLATTREQYEPDVAKLIADFNSRQDQPYGTARIVANKQACEISHLSLWRDVYYTNSIHGGRSLWAMPDRPVTLGADEYFVMGDNSSNSADARYWDDPVRLPGEDLDVQAGRVPGRFLLGKAFFVYWPAGYRPFDTSLPALIPNFGQMRSIH